MANIANFWPLESGMRQTQTDAFKWIESLPAHIKYIILEIPVGGGKSPIALTASGYFTNSKGNSVVFTPQKILQKQYENSFDNETLFSLYGKANYTCECKNTNCDIGSSIKPTCSSCPHKEAVNRASESPNVILNYALGLISFYNGFEYTGNRNVVVFDEAHNLETQLCEFNSLVVSDFSCRRYNTFFTQPKTLDEALRWIASTYLPLVEEKKKNIDEQVKLLEGKRSLKLNTLVKELKETTEHLSIIYSLFDVDYKDIKNDYVLVNEKSSFKIKLLYGKKVFNDLFANNNRITKCIFLSSTILNYKQFAEDIGLDLDKTAFISMDSEFPDENRPIYYVPIAKMVYGWDLPENKHIRDEMSNAIINLLNDEHKNDNGVIHTGSFAITNWLIKEIKTKIKHKIYSHGQEGDEARDEVITKFSDKANKELRVLISPSVTEGLDLIDELGRFSMFVKIPYPSIGDAWVKRRMEISNMWYNIQTMKSVIQGSGRHVRTPTDYGVTYIFDSSFGGLLNRVKKYVPQWWLRTLKE